MPTLYIETSIVSYLCSPPSSQVISAARQLLTRRWWEEKRHEYDLFTSKYVMDEAARGTPDLARKRLETLGEIPLLEITDEIPTLADRLLEASILPPKARLDALHIFSATLHQLDYLMTWNCSHIANARITPRIAVCLNEAGHLMPIICTPEEMVDEQESLE